MKTIDKILSIACGLVATFQIPLTYAAFLLVLDQSVNEPIALVAFLLFASSTAVLMLAGWRLSKLDKTQAHEAEPTQPPRPDEAEPASTIPPESSDGITALLCRSHDLRATLADLAANPGEAPDRPSRRLAQLASHLDSTVWDGLPALTCDRLTRTGQFWITTQVDADDIERLLAVEATMNLALSQDPGDLVSNLRMLDPLGWEPRVSYPTDDSIAGSVEQPYHGEWDFRLGMASFMESLPSPLRISFEFAANVGDGIACVDVALPGPRVLSCLDASPNHLNRLVAQSSLDLCLLAAKAAFSSSPAIAHAIVNGIARTDDKTLLSLNMSRETLSRLLLPDNMELVTSSALPPDRGVRMSLGREGELLPVEPFMLLSDPILSAGNPERRLELDQRKASNAMRTTCGAHLVSDLGINESAGRVEVAEHVLSLDCKTTGELVGALMAHKEQADDITVVEACERTAKALVSGELDVADRDGVRHSLVQGTSLDLALQRVGDVSASSSEPFEIEQALSIVEDALSPIDSLGVYEDDARCVYRYFNSIPERIAFNLQTTGDARKVILVPDAYYGAHLAASRFNNALGRHERALEHALVLDRIAPRSLTGRLAHALALDAQSKLLEESTILRSLIPLAITTNDAALVHYKLAYLEWRLGNNELGAACYLRAMSWSSPFSELAASELKQLVEEGGDYAVPSNDTQAAAVLERNGIPAGIGPKLISDLAAQARVTCDEGCFSAARAITFHLFEAAHDDALIGVYQSMQERSEATGD